MRSFFSGCCLVSFRGGRIMKNTKFTKGEWEPNALVNGRGFDISFNDDGECITEVVHSEHDAHLIASAPDMYKLLDEIADLMDFDDQSIADELTQKFDCIELLLKKARGEE
jgi:hypothetical protein